MRKAFSLFVVLIGLSTVAHAGILIEPYFGYDTGDSKTTLIVGNIEGKDTVSGPSFGLRLGYKFMIPWIALDYSLSEQSYDNGGKKDLKKTALGAVIGADIPFGLRIFGGYGFDEKFRGENSLEFSGTYTKVGLGMGLVPMVAVNLEYIMHKIEKVKNGSVEVNADTLYSKQEYNSIFLSISAPFNL